jgi:hypothetical protein
MMSTVSSLRGRSRDEDESIDERDSKTPGILGYYTGATKYGGIVVVNSPSACSVRSISLYCNATIVEYRW